MTPSENQPHALVVRGAKLGPIFRTYQEAHEVWKRVATWEKPFDIMVVATGRIINPGAPVIGVNE